MSIKKSADGLYHTNISFEGKRYAVTGRTEAEAHRKAGKLRAELETGHRTKRRGVTVTVFAKEWLETYRNSDSENDKRYRQITNTIIIPELGGKKLLDVTEADLQQFLNRHSHYSFSQLSKIRMTLKQIFKKARKNHLIVDDPSEDLTLPECKKGKHRALTEEEIGYLLQAADKRPDGLYMKIMLYCGLRPQEVDALQWAYVDLENDLIYVRYALKHKTGKIGPPKSEAGERDVPIPQILKPALVSAYTSPEDFVVNHNGARLTESSRYRLWKAIYKQMDILAGAVLYRNQIIKHAIAQDLDLYDLRHTYCTHLQAAGVPLNVAKELMGHDDISVTANIYTHTSSDTLKQAIDKMDTYLHEQAEEPIAPEQQLDNKSTKIIQFPGARVV